MLKTSSNNNCLSEMNNLNMDTIVSKIKKVIRRPKNSKKYFEKILTIAIKHTKKIQKVKQDRKEIYIKKSERTIENFLNTSTAITEDSGISYASLSVVTNAIIEPLPTKFTKGTCQNTCSTILEDSTKDDIKHVDQSQKLTKKSCMTVNLDDNDKITKKQETFINNYHQESLGHKQSYKLSTDKDKDKQDRIKALYCLANGYSPLQKWATTNLEEIENCNLPTDELVPPNKQEETVHRSVINVTSSLQNCNEDRLILENCSSPLQTPKNYKLSINEVKPLIVKNPSNGYTLLQHCAKTKENYKLAIEEIKLQTKEDFGRSIKCNNPLRKRIKTNIESGKVLNHSKLATPTKEVTGKDISHQTVHCLANGYSPLQKWVATSIGDKKIYKLVIDETKAPNSSQQKRKAIIENEESKLTRQENPQQKRTKTDLNDDSYKLARNSLYDVINSYTPSNSAPKKPPRAHLSREYSTVNPRKNIQCSNNKNDITNQTIDDINKKSNSTYSVFKNGLNTNTEIEEKFVVNLFNSRESKRWKRQSFKTNLDEKIEIFNEPPMKMSQKKAPVLKNEKSDSTKEEIYYKMKKMRDIECVKMKESSNALWTIKNNKNRSWNEELLAESILLETELRYKSIVNKIRDNSDYEILGDKSKLSGGVSLSNFQFEFIPQDSKKRNTDVTFFVLAVSNDTEIITTKAVKVSEDNNIVFNDVVNLRDLDENFQIKIEIFSISLNTTKVGLIERLLKKKAKCCYPINKIYFENVNTYELQESAVLKTSFTSCGELTITKKDLGCSLFYLKKYQGDMLKNKVTATLTADYVNLNKNLSGFLNLGKMDEDKNLHNWERKWCTLNNKTISIYSYPQDEVFSKTPAAVINLEYCFIPVIKNPKDCPRKRTFIIKTGRPSTHNDSNYTQLRRKNNFILNKYYLSADSSIEFKKWTEELDSAVEELDAWNKLIFKDDYYL